MKPRLTYSGVVSTLALFLAVSTGGAYAKATLIDGKAIRTGSMPANRIAPNSITAAQIKNGSIGLADLSTATRSNLGGSTGTGGTDTGGTGGCTNPDSHGVAPACMQGPGSGDGITAPIYLKRPYSAHLNGSYADAVTGLTSSGKRCNEDNLNMRWYIRLTVDGSVPTGDALTNASMCGTDVS